MLAHGSLTETLALLEWQRLRFELICTRAIPNVKEHPLVILYALLKSVKVPGAAPAPIAFHVLGRNCLELRIRIGERFPMEAVFCRTGSDYVARWRDALGAWLAAGSKANFALIDAGEPERRSLASLPDVDAAAREARLDFATPLPFERAPGAQRTAITREAFLSGLEKRFKSLFGVALGLTLRDGVRTWLRHKDALVAAIALASTAAIVGLLGKGMVESIFEKYRLATMLGFLLGMVASSTLSLMEPVTKRATAPASRAQGLV